MTPKPGTPPLTTVILPKVQDIRHPSPPITGRLGDYEIVGEVARGGMGVVYKALDTRTGRTVALKMILAESLGDISLKRFQSEASAAAALDHPNIVPIYEVGETGGQPFFTMKLIEGGNLSSRLTSFHKHLRKGVALLAKVARAVHHAHQRGVLHRDLKPSNILVNNEDEPFVTDFGLARRFDEQSNLTLTGTLIGTPNFIAPELLGNRRQSLTTASDIFSLGGILYNVLTGQPPFHSESLFELLHGVQHTEPQRPSLLNQQVDADLETICLKCLEKDPRNRYRSALELAEDLERWLGHETIVARRATPAERAVKWARRRPLVAALSAAIILAVIGGIVGITFQWQEAEHARKIAEDNRQAEKLAKEDAERQRAKAEEALSDTAAMLTDSELEKADALLAAGDSGGGLSYLARVLRRQPGNLVASGRIMSFLRQRSVALPEILSSANQSMVLDAALSQDGNCLVTAIDKPGNNIQITHFDASARLRTATHAFDTLATTAGKGSGPFFGKGVVRTKAQANTPEGDGFRLGNPTAARPRLPIIAGFFSISFSPDDKRIVSAANSGTVQVWDAFTGAAVTPVLQTGSPVVSAALTTGGRSVAAVSRMGRMQVWNLATGEVTQDVKLLSLIISATFSPDASHVLLIRVPGIAQIWDVRTGKVVTTLEHEGLANHTAWSSDGQVVALAAESEVNVWRLDQGSGSASRMKHPLPVATLVLNADGSKLVTGSDDQFARVWDTRTGEQLVPPLEHADAVRFITFSADGRKIATISQGNAIRVFDTLTGRPVCEPMQLRSPGVFAQFTPGGRALIVLCSDSTISRHTFVSPPPPIVALTDAGRVRSASFSPDGRMLLTASANGRAQLWDVTSGRSIRTLDHDSPLVSAAMNADGSQIVTAGTDQMVRLWETRSGRLLGQSLHESNRIFSVRFRSDEQVAISTVSGLGTVWKPRTGEQLSPFPNYPVWRESMIHSSTNRVLGILVAERAAAIYDYVTGSMTGPLLKHSDVITSCNFSPDGRYAITTSSDNTANLWDTATSLPLTGPLRHDGAVYFGAFAPDNQQAVTASKDKTARLWRIAPGVSLTRTLLHEAGVRYAEFSQDGARLLTVASDFTVHLWDVRLGRRLADPLQFKTAVVSAHFSPDGQTIFAASEDGDARLWSVPALPLPAPAWLADVAEQIGGSRIDPKGLNQPALRQNLSELINIAPGTDPYAREIRRLLLSAPAAK